ncbi:MAG TPA: hypothetical protein VLG50_06965 [Candidatus Saccharimonadales bacterium]|nr:hypothetical protein [Candidatus Saccharimonadales bacterium]
MKKRLQAIEEQIKSLRQLQKDYGNEKYRRQINDLQEEYDDLQDELPGGEINGGRRMDYKSYKLDASDYKSDISNKSHMSNRTSEILNKNAKSNNNFGKMKNEKRNNKK